MIKTDVEAIYSLSPMQQGMLFHSLYAPSSGVYVQQLSCTLQGRLNLVVFSQVWQRLVDRHPILRTAFVWQGLEKPLQAVQRHVKLEIVQEDWRDRLPDQQANLLTVLLQADQNEDFNLSKAPLMRLKLIRKTDETYSLIWTHHHLLADGWSMPLLLDEVFIDYEMYAQGHDQAFPPRRLYRDYIAWLKQQDGSAAESFWRKNLQGIQAPTMIALNRRAGSRQEQAGYGDQSIQLPVDKTAALQMLATKHQLTLNTLVQGAWALLLSRYSNQDDVVFGTTVAGRPAELAGVETMIGLFINTLPMRVQVPTDTPLLHWLQQFQAQQVELRQYEYSSLVQIQGWSEVPRSLPLFESIVVFENYPIDPAVRERARSLRIQDVHHAVKTNYPLTILAIPGSQLVLRIKYESNRFDAATVAEILSQFQSLLIQVAINPHQAISGYSLATPTSQALLPDPTIALSEPQYELVIEMLNSRLRVSNHLLAVSQGDHGWSYAELATRANDLAQALLNQGLPKGAPVAVLGNRCFGLIASMVGVLLSGGVLLTVDRHLPLHRQRLMLQTAKVEYLILLDDLPEAKSGQKLDSRMVLQIDPDTAYITTPASPYALKPIPLPELLPDDPAYLFFTSGTTGVPKGILGSHKGLGHFLSWQRQTFAVGSADRCAQLVSLSFDVLLRDVFLPLVSGATLCLPDDDEILASDHIFTWLEREQITRLHTVPAIVQSWLLNPDPHVSLANLRSVFFAGEPLSEALVRHWRTAFPEAGDIVNLYGPTETTLAKCCYIVPSEICSGVQPIGKPLPDTQALVLGTHGQLCGIGEPGEIVIRTPFRSLGYLNLPAAQQRFVKNPFRDDEQDRLYFTGDRGCYQADGLLKILGRLDHQVKIRGVRIEPDEVMAVLAEHPAVKSCVAIARTDKPGQTILVAYVVAATPTQDLLTELRTTLSQRLPSAMIPSAFVFLEQLPLTANGKVDHQALPAPDLASIAVDESWVMPQTPIEELVAGIWSQMLGVLQVGRYSNFFDLGGHSLLATQLISRLRDTFQIEMPLRRLFEAPTLAELATSIEDAQHADLGMLMPPLKPVLRDRTLPLSFAQQRLWFLDQLELGSPAYNIPAALRVTGSLNVAALERALQDILRRHEVLRTSFITVNGSPVQVIDPNPTLTVSVVDLQALAETEQAAEVQRLVCEDAQKPFDLCRSPLIRATLLQLGKNSHALLFNMHHIASDGWSMGIFIHELSSLYQAFCARKPSPLPELPIQYVDFAHWQRQYLSGEVLERQLDYWKQQLAGIPPLLELPADRPRPPERTFQGGTIPMELNADLMKQLKSLSQQSGTTLFMTLLAAFSALLSRYSGQEDIVVGSPIANRNRGEIESLIGFFVNTLVLRVQLQDNPSFEEVLKQVRQVSLDAYTHQDMPFEQLVEALRPERNLTNSPLFQVMFVLQNAPMGELELPGVNLTPIEGESVIAKFDLTLFLGETAAGLKGRWEYNSDLFEAATIERMSQHFQNLLEAIVANPQLRVAQLPLLSEAERQQFLVEWNDTQTDYPQDKAIHQLFEEQVERSPDAVAVVFEEKQLTYRELNARANQLAHYLQTLGVGPEELVGICVERSLDLVVGLLGILKAGGAYVPLDPTYPQERLAYIMEDSQMPLLLTTEKLILGLPKNQVRMVCLDSDWSVISNERGQNSFSRVSPKNLAYVIYTSGSTGQPKGVLIQHQSLVSFTKMVTIEYSLSQKDRVLQFASISFDAAAEEIYPCLTCGATLVLRTEEMLGSIATFVQQCHDLQLTVLDLPTAYWHQITAQLATTYVKLPESLRLTIIGGETALPTSLKIWSELVGSRLNLINTYGPTEGTVVATIYKIIKGGLDISQVPIGCPIGNIQVYILDRHLKPAPIGVAGELHIGGVGLARGYLNRPELTVKKFISNPFSFESEDRLFKTGDLARYRPDGNIEFLGRIDNQVKIRGFRIELGEIEAALSQHPQVQEAVVVARQDQPSNKRLVAYLVSRQVPVSLSELRQFLSQKLPDYMVPSAFVELKSMPLTPNGKVDRHVLPAPDLSGRNSEEGFVAPRTPTEEILVAIWAEVLGVQQIGIHDNFFELGGHSLLATQVSSRLRETFFIEVPLRQLFASPTPSGLVEFIELARQTSHPLQPDVIESVSRETELPLSFAQERLWFLDQLEGGSATYNMPVALRLDGSLNVAALERALQDILRRHEVLRTSFITVNGSPVQVIDPNPTLTVSVVDLQALAETEQAAEVQRLVCEDAQKPFDLCRSPLIRATLLQLGKNSHALLFNMHHIASDGWSMGIFIHELSSLYQAFCARKPSPLPELPIQYVDFAHWQRQYLSGEVLERQLDYWKQQLAGIPPLLELPTDRPRPAVQTFRGARRSLTLSTPLTKVLKQLSQQEGVTLFMTLLAAFKTLLYRYTAQDDVVVGTPIAGRNRSEIEGLIGFFVNTLVLRTDLSGNPSFRTLLKRVREVALGAYAHPDLPFEKLVGELQPDRNLSHSPVFQVLFVFENQSRQPLMLPEITLTPLVAEDGTAKFDLTLFMTETAEKLIGEIEYNTDLFDASTIVRMLGHWQTLLESIAANPVQQLSNLALLTTAETYQLLGEWNATQANFPHHACIHTLFEQQVEQTPNAIAVVFETEYLTYQDLNHRANKLAHYLRARDVGAETFVGICVERNLDMVVGILGILKAGGAYVPLDPKYPQERLAFILADAQVPVLLTQQRLLSALPAHFTQVICLDTHWSVIAQESGQNPVSDITAQSLAYVIYTSGSTGKPKGVAIAHRSAVAFLTWAKGVFSSADLAGVLAATSICFDLSIFELFLPLSSGGKIILAENALQLPELPAAAEITLVNTVPSAIAELVRVAGLPPSLRVVNLAGEPLLNSLAQAIYRQDTVQRVFNLYGPSEDTTYSTFTLVEKGSTELVCIGLPIANTQVYLLDAQLQPVPIGVPGELYIGGAGLARCYLNRPDLTAEKFIPDPFNSVPGARLYKTNDLGRYRTDGTIEFLGRVDRQVKLRGFRIELGEIETVLTDHPAVQETVVLLREDSPGDRRLVAYCVPTSASLTRPISQIDSDLCSVLKEKLPNYMVPSAFVLLESLPLTPNGKIDRQALPAPNHTQPNLDRAFVSPRTPIEEILAGIWAEVLRLKQVGVHDNFFNLGGNSLTIIQVMSRLNETFQIELPLRRLFESPTVAELAEAIEVVHQGGKSGVSNAMLTPDLQAEAVLDPTICPGTLVYQPVEPVAVLLTGATGFLGAFLLAELLRQTHADIYCLVRSSTIEAGKQRLQKTLESYSLWEPGFGDRIIPVLGDLSQPLLGLSEMQFQTLASQMDVIYHNGALVNHVYPYTLLKAANVQATEIILRLASQIKIKPVHFISTTSVFSSDAYFKAGVIREMDALEHSQGLSGGYAQSKWVAEKLVMMARDRGLPCCIYRAGRIAWHSQTGVWNTNDLLYRLIKGCIQLGSVPDLERQIEITPVDFVSQAIIHLSRQPKSLGQAFHLVNPQSVPWNQLVHCLRASRYSLQPRSYDDWQAELLHNTQDSADNALYSLVAFTSEIIAEEQTAHPMPYLQFDRQNTLDGLARTSIRCPDINDELLRIFFSHFRSSEGLNALLSDDQSGNQQFPQGE